MNNPDFISLNPVFYGMGLVPQQYWKEYGFALLTIAGSDGELSGPELSWLVSDLASELEVPSTIVDEWKAFDATSADLVDLFASFSFSSIASFNKVILYDAMRMSYADNEFSDNERNAIATAARLLNLDKEALVSIEALVELERAAEKLRSTLI